MDSDRRHILVCKVHFELIKVFFFALSRLHHMIPDLLLIPENSIEMRRACYP